MSVVERVLSEVDAMAHELVEQTATLVRIPSISGTDAENDAQFHVAGLLAEGGLDVDHWRIDLERADRRSGLPRHGGRAARGVGPRRSAPWH